MRRTFRGFAVVAVLAVPAGIGWAYSAGASVGARGSGFAGTSAEATVDDFLVDGYLITRESQDGVVTMSVVGPDGAAVLPADLPDHIAERVAYFESDWSADEASAFEVVDDVACFVIASDLGSSADLQVVEDTDSVVRALEATSDEDGNTTARARQWNVDDLTSQQLELLLTGDAQLADLPEGTDVPACDG